MPEYVTNSLQRHLYTFAYWKSIGDVVIAKGYGFFPFVCHIDGLHD